MTSPVAIKVEKLSKHYRLGVIGHGTLKDDVQRRWARLRGKSDPLQRIDPHHSLTSKNDLWALRGIDFEIKQGEIVGIIGRNGAGKSSILKILSRITAPTTGQAMVRGRLASLLEVGTGFHPELTGRENVFLNGTILGMRAAEVRRKFDEIVAFSGVEQFIDTPVKRYSSGMYVRLAFAVAAHLEPDVLVIDEVLAVGDAGFQAKCLGKLGDVARGGRTVLFVSHNMVAVQRLCTRAIWLRDGYLEQDGEPAGVISSYLDATTEILGDARHEHPGFLYQLNEAALNVEQPARVLSLQLLDADETPTLQAETWGRVTFRIVFEVRQRYRSFSAVLSLATADGLNLILTSTSPDQTVCFSVEPGMFSVDCTIDKFPLAAGEYLVGLGLAIPGVEYVWRNDAVCRLHVAAKDVFESGLAPASSRYLVATAHRWHRPLPVV